MNPAKMQDDLDAGAYVYDIPPVTAFADHAPTPSELHARHEQRREEALALARDHEREAEEWGKAGARDALAREQHSLHIHTAAFLRQIAKEQL